MTALIRILKNHRKQLILAVILLLTVAGTLAVKWNEINQFSFSNNYSLHYVKARVLSVDEENLTEDELEAGRYIGTQELTLRILTGDSKGEVITMTNYMSRTINVRCREGQTILICADIPDNAEPYYTIYNYDRSPAVLAILLIFAAAVLLIGRKQGLLSILGLTYTVFFIILFLVQAVFHGFSAVGTTAVTILCTCLASLLLLTGFTRKTVVGVLGTLLGVLISGVAFLAFSQMLHLSGYNSESAESLLLIVQTTGLELKPLLAVCVLITALGAVMDVAVSVSSALYEIVSLNPDITRRALIASGMNIGRDMIGTMTNTLILAYTGTALPTMLLLLGYGYQFNQLISSDYLAIELSSGIASTIGVVMTVPLASVIAALVFVGNASAGKVRRRA
ncbi:MAG: YibE/F family protein [Oscillospiraceae bacterium]|nr:YibE/F family protein [Oscillospiraceae bacterium]